jgi:fatty acid desaturase
MSSAAHEEETKIIRQAIQSEEFRLKLKYPILSYQTQIGFGLWLSSILSLLGNAYAYSQGWYPGWAAFLFAGFPLSVLHEIEHDLIHRQYFPASRLMQDIMLFFIWIFKCNQELSPFVRRDLHLHHHNRSGQIDDIEERLIGLGIENNYLRLATAICPGLGVIYIHAPGWGIQATTSWRLLKLEKNIAKELLKFAFDLILITLPISLLYLAWNGNSWASFLWILWAGPNALRHACLALLSSYSHYSLVDKEKSEGDITLQNQILNHWTLLPLQLFCFNFGAEHIIHHFYVHQPFYLRHWCRQAAWKVMVENGIRINDFGVVWRANRRDD